MGLMVLYILRDVEMNRRIQYALSPYPMQGSRELNLTGCKLSHSSPNYLWLLPHIMLQLDPEHLLMHFLLTELYSLLLHDLYLPLFITKGSILHLLLPRPLLMTPLGWVRYIFTVFL